MTTPPLAEFLRAQRENPQVRWTLDVGDAWNLLDEACEQIADEHASYHSACDALMLAGQVIGLLAWRDGAGVGDQRVLIVPSDPDGTAHAVRIDRVDDGWSILVEKEES